MSWILLCLLPGSPGRSSVFPLSVRNYKHVVRASEAGTRFVNRPIEGSLLRALNAATETTGDNAAHGTSVRLFVKLGG